MEFTAAAVAHYEAAWQSERCPNDGGEKWANFPFCRKCSIRLQRIGLMRRLKVYCGHSAERFRHYNRKWLAAYDVASDYLHNVVNLKQAARANQEDEHTSD